MYKKTFLSLFLAVCFSFEAGFAQASFSAKTDFTTGTEPYSVATGDFNGDGKVDMAVANTVSGTVSIFLNTTIPGAAAPSFSDKIDFETGTNPNSVAIGDFNGDGMIDMAVANTGSGTVSVFLNTTAPGATTPSFSDQVDFESGTNPNSVAIGDFNGDGIIDMAVTNHGSKTVSVFLNTTSPGATTPTFSTKTDFTTGYDPYSVAIGDFNGDGKNDMAVTNYGSDSLVSIFLNTTAPGAATPTFSTKADFTTGSMPTAISVGDFNGDGMIDMAVANVGSANISVFLNTTAPGATTPAFSAKADFTTGIMPTSIFIEDFNGDGKCDMAVANAGSNTVSVLLNTTAPGAATPAFSGTDFETGGYPCSISSGDFNGDDKNDMAIVNCDSSTVSILLNTTTMGVATPSFSTKVDFTTGTGSRSVAIGDFNGDGKNDIVVGNNTGASVLVYLNTTTPGAATPSFSDYTAFTTGSWPLSVSIGDFNGDGKNDIIAVNASSNTVSVLLNTTTPGAATPTFSPKTDFATGSHPCAVAIGDFNGDGMIDIAVTNIVSTSSSYPVSVFLNTTAPGAATPSFSAKTDFMTESSPQSIAIGDFNGDGKNDMAVANNGTNTVSVFLNTTAPGAGTPAFSAKTDFITGAGPQSVAIGDFNGDGKNDMVVANFNDTTFSVFLNTTVPGAVTPSFSARTDFRTGYQPYSVSIGDVSGDGKNDITVVNYGYSIVSVFLNTTAPGAATPAFSAKTDYATGRETFSVAIGDLNGDGKNDMAVVNQLYATVSVFLNNADFPLPVELLSFTASTHGSNVTLNWHTATEVNNYGFEIERRAVKSEQSSQEAGGQATANSWQKIGFVKGAGTSNAPKAYSYSDASVSSGSYVYRLKQIDQDGTYKYSDAVEVSLMRPAEFVLEQNYPNPFNPSTTISFTLAKDGLVTLKVYDMLGREVAMLVNKDLKAGVLHNVIFDASRLSTGIYIYRLQSRHTTGGQAGNNVLVKKLILIK